MRKIPRALLDRDPRNIQHQIAAITLLLELGEADLEVAAFYIRDLGGLCLPGNIIQSCSGCKHPVQHASRLTKPYCYFCTVDRMLVAHHMEQHRLAA